MHSIEKLMRLTVSAARSGAPPYFVVLPLRVSLNVIISNVAYS